MPRLRQGSSHTRRLPSPDVGPLGKNASSFVSSGEESRQSRRREQWDALRVLWDCSTLDRVRKCRRTPRGQNIGLELKTNEHRARYTGLSTCASVWACPCCSARINAARSDELRQALERWHASGGTVVLLTLTMRHRAGVPLSTYWDALTPALAASLGGRYSRARKAKESAQMGGYAITREATHGPNGWHLHAHALLFLAAGVSGEVLEELGAALFAAWSSRLVREGLDAPTVRSGIDLRALNLAQAREHAANYLAKGTYEATRAASELTGASGKTARRGNRTPWDCLADVAAHRRPADLALWREWEQTSRGRRALTWSSGLRARLGLGEERADEEIADENTDDLETVLVLTPAAWRVIRQRGRGPCDLLDAAECAPSLTAARAACLRLLMRWGVPLAGLPPPGTTTAAAWVPPALGLAAA